MLASMAEGRNFEEEEGGDHKRGDTLRCNLTMEGVEHTLKFMPPVNRARSDVEGVDEKPGNDVLVQDRVWKTTNLAVQLANFSEVRSSYQIDAAHHVTNTKMPKSKLQAPDESASMFTQEATACFTSHQWKLAYDKWHHEVYVNDKTKTPNAAQKQVLELIHNRRLVEHAIENNERPPANNACSKPLLQLIHGLPGAGKTEVLRWVRSYFETVWLWTSGKEFAFIAPLNSMASSISGETVHSWGNIQYKNRRGILIGKKQRSATDEVPSMTIQVFFWVASGQELFLTSD